MDTGGKIRTGKILEQLSKLHEITLVSNVEYQKDEQYLPQINKLCSRFIPVPWKETKRYTVSFFMRLSLQMFSIYPVSALNDYSKTLKNIVEQEIANGSYDLAICDFVQSALMFDNIAEIPTLLFQHNVESIIAKRHVERSQNIITKAFWWLQWKKMFSYEKKACNSFDTVIAVSEKDKELFLRLYRAENVKTIPTGVDLDYYAPMPQIEEKENSLVFCGSMDWLPNEDAINYFIEDILPLVKKEVPGVHLTVVGRNPSPAMQKKVKKCPEVSLTGWVEDTRPYLAQSSLFIVPIRIGGGTRMKIFEAMAMRKAVISTTIGAEGLPLKDGENIILEDEAATFAIGVNEMLVDEEKKEKIVKNARNYVEDNFSWKKIAAIFSNICASTKRETLRI